jgi:hypothetical protein
VVALGANEGLVTSPLLPSGLDLMNATADDARLYLPGGGKLFALNRETMKESWRTTLPELPAGVRWRVTVCKTTLAVYPTWAVGEPLDVTATATSALLHPTELRLIGTTAKVFDATRCVFPVLILDPTTGKQLQRIDMLTLGPAVVVLPRGDALLVASVGKAVWVGK